jgi:hypothetical protein
MHFPLTTFSIKLTEEHNMNQTLVYSLNILVFPNPNYERILQMQLKTPNTATLAQLNIARHPNPVNGSSNLMALCTFIFSLFFYRLYRLLHSLFSP